MIGKIVFVHCWYDVRRGSTTVEMQRLIVVPDGYKSSLFLNPTDASMARLANVITNQTQVRISTFKDGYSACISPPQVVSNV